jgi:hypothetical protein
VDYFWYLMVRILVRVVVLLTPLMLTAAERGTHGVDFRNFEYPWIEELGVPSNWEWRYVAAGSHVRLKNGWLTLDPADPPHSAYLHFGSVTFGDLDGDRQDEAVVDLLYGSGGTANWHYLYVFKATNGTVVPIGILKSGSRAYGGLADVRISKGLLILDFADEDRREGDCCSRGIIRVRYRLQGKRFLETGSRQKDSVRSFFYPFDKEGPQTVKTSLNQQKVNIVYTDANGVEKPLTASGVNTEPSLSSDKSSVVFLREPNQEEKEIWAIGTDGSGLRLLFRGSVRWNSHVYPSSSLRLPQWSTDGKAVYFVTDFTATSGALWRLDLATSKAAVMIPDAVMYGVIQTGRYRGFLVANQRALSKADSDGSRYPAYPFFLYTARGEKVQPIGDETEDLDGLLADWEGR